MKSDWAHRGRCALFVIVALGILAAVPRALAEHHPPKPPSSVRLYVFDCGAITGNFDPKPFSFTKEELATTDMSVASFLIVDPRGTLMWDTGFIPDSAFQPGGGPVVRGVARDDKPLLPQLAAIGYIPADITYLALSHYHADHSGNASLFASSTWLVRKVEYDAVFSGKKIPYARPADFTGLKNSKHIFITTDQYDVFGDGKVIILSAPGHTPGHQVLFVDLAKTGPVVLSGDLYHYPEERKLGRIPAMDYNQEETRESRAKIEAFVKQKGAQLWIQHDIAANRKLKKAPAYYD